MRSKLLLSAVILTAALSACNAKTEATFPTAAAQAKSPAPTDNTKAEATSPDLMTITELMGKQDEEVVAVFGEGEAMKNEEGFLLYRDYTIPVLGDPADVSLKFNMYDYGKNKLESCTINFQENDLEKYKEEMIPLFGEPEVLSEASYSWESGNSVLILASPYGDAPYIEISLK